jgi:hypothetical protein
LFSEVREEHARAVAQLKDTHEQELQNMADTYEEQQVSTSVRNNFAVLIVPVAPVTGKYR